MQAYLGVTLEETSRSEEGLRFKVCVVGPLQAVLHAEEEGGDDGGDGQSL